MKTTLLLAACAAALTACAGTETAVRANSAHDFGTGVRTYAFAREYAAQSDGEEALYARAIGRRLAQYGFAAEPAKTARYRLVLSHETRPATVVIGYARCADEIPCGAAAPPSGMQWPGAMTYVHSLTLRFFDLADGHEAYKVSATKRDRDPDARRDIDVLVGSALARLPFEDSGHPNDRSEGSNSSDWKVTLRRIETDAAPRVTRIAPLER